MDLDTAADELYAGSPDDFVERRTALAARARAARDRPLVKQILALRRPTRTAWLLNVLSRECPAGVAELLDLGTALQDAQQRLAGAELRTLSAERRRLVDRLAREAVQRGAQHGYPTADAALQEVSQSLQAAMADPAVGDQLRAGRLTGAVTYGGFGPSNPMAALAASMAKATAKPAATAATEPAGGDGDTERERAARAARVADATAAWQTAVALVDEAESAANEATARADELADRVDELRAELERSVAEEAAARDAARAARRRHQDARFAATSAEQARDAAVSEQPEPG